VFDWFSKRLRLPSHLRIEVSPNPNNGSKLLVVQAWRDHNSEPETLHREIESDPEAIAFGKMLVDAVEYLYAKVTS